MINPKLILKGAAMGCADLIPGVSGGTIALVTGIYEELINSIRSADAKALKLLFSFQLQAFWKHINGPFLLHVFGGVIISLFSLSSLFSYLLDHHPVPVWSFFFGLILISAFYVFPTERSIKTIAVGLLGIAVGYTVTVLSPASTPDQLWFLFISGAIAICAMILPGISGSFILILLAKYEFVLEAVKTFNLKVIIVFGIGCVVGLVSFSKFLHWLLKHYQSTTMACLAGFMLGSLNKIWPWKEVVNDFSFKNMSPAQFTATTGEPSQWMLATIFCILGGLLVFVLERLGNKTA